MATATAGPQDKARAQRMEALARANAVRTGKAQLKAWIAAGGGRAAAARAILGEAGAYGDSLYVRELLLAVPGIGPSKVKVLVRGVCTHLTGPERLKIGELTQRQRELLVERLTVRP